MGIKFSMSNRQVKRKFSAYSRGVGSSQSGGQHYASSGNANTPLTKSIVEAYTKTGQAMGAGGGLPNVMYGQPMFFSPLHTPQNWQIASKRREIFQWSRFYYSNEPKVAAGVDFYCFVPTTQILMADGSQKSISSIKKDDLVRSHDGTVNSVEEIHKKYIDEEILVIKIAGVSQDTLKVTPGHKLLTEKEGQIDFVQAGTLKTGDYLLTPIKYERNDDTPYPVKEKYLYRKINLIKVKRYSGDVFDLTISNKHSYIANRIAVHNSEFPLNGFVLECKDKKILKFFERTVKRLKLNYWLKAIGFERFLLGDVFPFVEYECKKCGGHALPDGTVCNHPGGTVGRIKVLNPDWITVHKNPISEEAVYMLEPDDELKGIIATKRPEAIYNSLPPALIESVSTGQPIVLSNRNISHVKYHGSPYSAYGTSMVRRMFTYLAYKTKLMTANWIIAERLILPIRIVKLGSDNRPATAADIADVSSQLVAVANDPNLTLVTHNNFDYSWEGACYSEDTEILTENGWKLFGKLEKDEKVATYNMDNKNLEYQLPTEYHEYDYDSTMFSPMYHFKNKYVDVLVTPNHRMLVERNSKMEVVYSQNVTHNDKFISTLNLENTTSEKRKDVKFNIRKKHIHRPDYIGKVYCVEVPNSMLIVRRNGMISIQGNSGKIHNITNELEEIGKEILDGFMLNQAILNGEASSYSSAQVGIEIMIARLESWRNELADWVENHIFLPIAMMQNFKDEEESKESDEDVFIYPKLKWNDLQLRDRTNFRQILMQLHDKGLISAQRLLEEFDIDYDQETRRIREEQALASATGQFLGQPQGGMGGMGGMPMGGGMGGGMPPMDIGGGGMPGMPGGEPGMPGAAPGMPGAAPAPGGMPTPMAAAQPLSPVPTFISKRGKGGKSMAEQQQEQAQQQAQQFQQSLQNIRLTTLEQKMLNGLSMLSGQIPYKFYLQYKIATAGQPQPYVLDFAYPDVGVGVEACGEVWHDQMDQKIHDQQRDQVLANIGWRILRFKEEAIDGKMPEILKVIYNNIAEAVKDKSRKVNKAASADERIKLAVPPSGMFDIDNNLKEDLKFQRIDMQDGLGHIYLVGT